jgi:hypothetical protein
VHSSRANHRHQLLSRARVAAATAAVLAAGTLAGGGALLAGAPAARADSITVTPSSPVLYTFTQFTVSGTVVDPRGVSDGFVQVAFNGVGVATARETDLDTGAFSATIIFAQTGGEGSAPVAPNCGANTVAVTAQSDNPANDFLVGSTTVNVGCASISVTPGLVGNQQLPGTFQVTPQNFAAPGGFTLTVDGAPQGFTTTAGGGLDFTGSPSCGPHRVVLAQTFNEQVISAAARITVLCPQITLAPPAVPLASQPATVMVTGTQFHAGQPVTITLNAAPVGSTVTGKNGGFSLPVTAAGLDCAAHQVTASEQATQGGPAFLLSASATLQVTRCTGRLAVDPAVLQPGELTHVTGTGFAPGRPVTLSWQPPSGKRPLLGTLTVTAGSDGSIGTLFLVLPNDMLGARQLVATQGAAKLTASAVVDPGPMQPVSGARLVYRQ